MDGKAAMTGVTLTLLAMNVPGRVSYGTYHEATVCCSICMTDETLICSTSRIMDSSNRITFMTADI